MKKSHNGNRPKKTVKEMIIDMVNEILKKNEMLKAENDELKRRLAAPEAEI
jgi:hypothetical protein